MPTLPRATKRSFPTRPAATTPPRGSGALFQHDRQVATPPPGTKRSIPTRPAATTPLPGTRARFQHDRQLQHRLGDYGSSDQQTGSDNTASGAYALLVNTTGGDNTASGFQALAQNTTGSNNTAYGINTLLSNTTGNNNIAVGYQAGMNLSSGSNNIEIGNEGDSGDARIIRIGTAGTQTKTFIAGIVDSKLTGNEVVITAVGQLGRQGLLRALQDRY